MEKKHRISAGGIVIYHGELLLVRYNDGPGGSSYLVAPGGGVIDDEGLNRAVAREVREETGLEFATHGNRILFVEDLAFRGYRLTKIWFLCDLVGGQLARTQGAKEEGISEAGWYRREQLDNEVVYPRPLLTHDWNTFSKDNWETIYLEMRKADVD